MKLENRTDITAYYDLSNCCNDNIEFIAMLLSIAMIPPRKQIISDLENLRVKKYEDNLSFLLDNLTTGTIKNLYSIYQLTRA
jgi:hypothetical protein